MDNIARQGEIYCGGKTVEKERGNIVVANKNIPHKFMSVGNMDLEMICIHPSPRILQEDLLEE